MSRGLKNQHHIVIVGGGLAGLEAAVYLRSVLGEEAAITLVSDRQQFTYRPFLTYVAFGLSPDRVQFDLKRIADLHDFRLFAGRVERVEPKKRLIRFGAHSLAYDSLILATGAATVEEPVPGLRRGFTVWNEEGMIRLHDRLQRAVEEASADRPARIVFLVPPKAAWTGPIYELAIMAATWLTWKGVRGAFHLRLVTGERRHVEALGPHVHERVAESLAYHGVDAATGRRAVRVEPRRVVFEAGEDVPFDILIDAAVYAGRGPKIGLPVDGDGFYRTRLETRQLVSFDDIYAVGDGSDYPVKQGFLALLQADAAAEHIASRVLDREPDFSFSATLFWLMEQFDHVLFARAEEEMGDVKVDKLPTGRLRRLEAMGYLPRRQRLGNPLYAGLLWKGTEIGLTLVKQLEASRRMGS